MKILQLFRRNIDRKLLNDLLLCFNLQGIDDCHSFSKWDLTRYNTISHFEKLIPRLIEVYLPCKSKIYLRTDTVKRCITVLKQVLKVFGHRLNSYEKTVGKSKVIYYKIAQNITGSELLNLTNNSNQMTLVKKNVIITFD